MMYSLYNMGRAWRVEEEDFLREQTSMLNFPPNSKPYPQSYASPITFENNMATFHLKIWNARLLK
jgi:hypothetical protein